jgi:hypothetical protein
MKKKVMSKEMAARALTILAQEHLKAYPAEERDRRIKAFGSKVAELRRKNAKSSSLAQLLGIVGKPELTDSIYKFVFRS